MSEPSESANFADALAARANAAGSGEAIVEGRATASWAQLVGRAAGISERLHDEGVRPGERIGILMPRGSAGVASFFGALGCGAVAVIINESLRARQVDYILENCGAKLLLASPDLLGRLSRPLEVDVPVLDPGVVSPLGDFRPQSRIGSDLAQIIYTSGSTGLPKGVALCHANLWAGTSAVVSYLGISVHDRIASLLPFSFDYGLNQLFCCVATGATLVVEHSPVAQRVARAVREGHVTVLPAVPPLWLQLLGVAEFCSKPIESLRLMTNTGGRLPVEAVRRLRAVNPQANLVLMYGLTEAFRATYLAPEKVDGKPNSIGQAIPGAEIVVIAEDGSACSQGEIGELVQRGPTVALGYWNDENSSQVFRPNPLRPSGTPDAERVVFSGDLVYRDEDGDLFFVGRRDQMIKTLGYRVSPDEVSDVLFASGEIAESVIDAEPDDQLGERIVAYVVLKPNGNIERLKSFCTSEMPRYMRPSRIEVRTSLGRTTSGKYDVAATKRTSRRERSGDPASS